MLRLIEGQEPDHEGLMCLVSHGKFDLHCLGYGAALRPAPLTEGRIGVITCLAY